MRERYLSIECTVTVTAKPPLASTHKKMIIVCDIPKPEKQPTRAEMQTQLDSYADLLKKLFGYSVKSKLAADELTLEVMPEKPAGDAIISIVRETLFFKRAVDQLFVIVTNDFTGALAFVFEPVQPDLADPLGQATMEMVEKLLKAEPGKCKFV